jgi:hypothetical protein
MFKNDKTLRLFDVDVIYQFIVSDLMNLMSMCWILNYNMLQEKQKIQMVLHFTTRNKFVWKSIPCLVSGCHK